MGTCQLIKVLKVAVTVSIEARYHVACLIILLQIFIKAVISSNRTFIDCERLSREGPEDELYELKSDDNRCTYVPIRPKFYPFEP